MRMSARIASGSSERGLSLVATTRSLQRAAASAIRGRLPRSRSPPHLGGLDAVDVGAQPGLEVHAQVRLQHQRVDRITSYNVCYTKLLRRSTATCRRAPCTATTTCRSPMRSTHRRRRACRWRSSRGAATAGGRLRAYRDTLEKHNLTVDESMIRTAEQRFEKGGYQGMLSLLKRNNFV